MIRARFCRSSLGALLLAAAVAHGQHAEPVQPPARETILGWMQKSPEFAREATGKKLVLCSVVRYAADPAAGLPQDIVEAVHYRYDDGVTLRTVCTPADRKVVEVEALTAYPTPLAPEEIEAARALAREKDAVLQKILAEGGTLAVETVALVMAERSNKLFGKRLAVVIARPKTGAPVWVTVNLTDRTIVRG